MNTCSYFTFMNYGKEQLAQTPVCIVYGFHEFLGEDVIRKYSETFLEERNEFNFKRWYFDPDEKLEWGEIVRDLKTSSFLVQSRKVIVAVLRLQQGMVLKKEEEESLKAYLENPNPNSMLIVYLSLDLMKDDYRNIRKGRMKQFIHVFAHPSVLHVDLDRMPETEAAAFIRDWFKQRDLHLTADGMEKMVEIMGGDLAEVIRQLPKFEIHATGEKKVDSMDVEAVLTGFQSHSIWDLVDAIRDNDIPGYLKTLDYLLIHGYKPVFITGTLISHYHKIFGARILLQKNHPTSRIARELRQPAFIMQRFIRSVRGIPGRRLAKIMDILHDIDTQSKTGGDYLTRLQLKNFMFRLHVLQNQ